MSRIKNHNAVGLPIYILDTLYNATGGYGIVKANYSVLNKLHSPSFIAHFKANYFTEFSNLNENGVDMTSCNVII